VLEGNLAALSTPMTTTNGSSTRRPVGGTPGRMAGMSTSWMKAITSSSITRPWPTVRETGVIEVSFGHLPMKCRA
jgi:hypothetical protein